MSSVVAPRLERTPISGAVVFLASGLLARPGALDLLDLSVSREVLETMAELTLALVLFIDSANADLRTLRRCFHVPQRPLLVGLPLTIALGFGVGIFLSQLTLLSVAILATMLAPTDAALGKAIVTNEAVPPPIREALDVESGLNDGICVPILFTLLAFAAGTQGTAGGIAVRFVTEEIGLGLVVGVGFSAAGRAATREGGRRGWVDGAWSHLRWWP